MSFRLKIFISALFIAVSFSSIYAQHLTVDSNSMNYRGKREPVESGAFEVVNVSTSRTDSSNVRFDVIFNQSIDPKSVRNATASVNGNRVSLGGITEFGKDGKKIRFILKVSEQSFNFELNGIMSYNGKTMSRLSLRLKDSGEARL